MDKQKLIAALKTQLEQEIVALKSAARATYEAATHEESKPENEYDTFALEASYLAGAQAQRIVEMEELISFCKFLEIKAFGKDDEIDSTALVEVKAGGKTSYLLFLPKGGGSSIAFEGKTVQVITPVSPLGEAMIGLQAGDIATVESGAKTKDYQIISVS